MLDVAWTLAAGDTLRAVVKKPARAALESAAVFKTAEGSQLLTR
jgi:hypothetical protein